MSFQLNADFPMAVDHLAQQAVESLFELDVEVIRLPAEVAKLQRDCTEPADIDGPNRASPPAGPPRKTDRLLRWVYGHCQRAMP